jgi:phosphoribosylaminoimidazolecarboxamide formyltransferase / IMP cyclohydrolase
MLRAAAKSHPDVIPVCRPEDYGAVLEELRAGAGTVPPETRRRLAGIAFARTAAYESAIARWFQPGDGFPEVLVPAFERELELAYGENPHQQAAYYAERGARTHLLGFVEHLHGKPLSFNNLNDLSAARLLVRELDGPACVIVKHANPCGVGVADTVDEAYARALAADPVSAYGGVVVVNRAVTGPLGEALAEQFVEVLFAPGYDERALTALTRKASVRVLSHTEQRAPDEGERDYRRVLGGLLVQERDTRIEGREGMEVVCGDVSEEEWPDLLFAWRVVKHVTSNAIVIARGGQTIGIGAGQMSRVDAVRIALEKARGLGHELAGSVLASDAFFPFADGPQLALEAGVTALVQPGGSKRDPEVVEAVSSTGAAMVFTHRRHFRH